MTEIICETKPTQDYPEYSEAIAVIDSSMMHCHKKGTEMCIVLKGELTVVTDKGIFYLEEGDLLTLKPGTLYITVGNKTWIKVSLLHSRLDSWRSCSFRGINEGNSCRVKMGDKTNISAPLKSSTKGWQ